MAVRESWFTRATKPDANWLICPPPPDQNHAPTPTWVVRYLGVSNSPQPGAIELLMMVGDVQLQKCHAPLPLSVRRCGHR